MVEPRSKIFIRLALVITIGLVALGMRLYFANRHVIDHDEPTYLNAALRYTNYLRSGEYTWLAWDQHNYQHPVLSKILYGIVLLTQDPLVEMHDKNFDTGMPIQSAEGRAWGLAGRYTSAALGTLASLAVAAINPLAGLFFATQSLNTISTSVVGLEALPLLTSFLAGIFYLSWVKQISSQAPGRYVSIWLGLSAVALGMTAASKYTYCVVGLAIVIHFFLTSAQATPAAKILPPYSSLGRISPDRFLPLRSLPVATSGRTASKITVVPRQLFPIFQRHRGNTPFLAALILAELTLLPGVPDLQAADQSCARYADRPACPDRPAGIVEAGKVLFHLAGNWPGVITRLADEMASVHADHHGSPVHLSRPGRPDNFLMAKRL